VFLDSLVNSILGLRRTSKLALRSTCVAVLLDSLVNNFLGLGRTSKLALRSTCVVVVMAQARRIIATVHGGRFSEVNREC